ncbi:MAG: hypothetical protein H6739_34680 [Alphaproteobacteria bacterium]|nr:hypothetical protein [Alphaproteobacteria bacterium]
MGKSSPLKTALQGGQVSDRQAQSALGAAVTKITSLQRRDGRSQEAIDNTGEQLVHIAETQGSLLLSSFAEGYFGSEKLKIAGIDLRAISGVAAKGYGLIRTLTGKKDGGHALALGNGLFGSWLASVGVKAGQSLQQRRAAEPPTTFTVPSEPQIFRGLLPEPTVHLTPEPTTAGPLREVMLTPSTEGEADTNRFVRARQD